MPGLSTRLLSRQIRRIRRIRPLLRPLASGLVLSSLAACGADSLKPPVVAEPSAAYWSLALDHQALTMGPPGSPYDTITITATPRNVAGAALPGLPAPTYISRDVTKVTVTPEGFVRVLGSGFEPVWIIATLVSENVRHADSVRVRSVDIEPPPVLATLSIQPVPPDSAKRAWGVDLAPFFGGQGFPPLQARAADADGVPLTDVMVSFRSLDPDVAGVEETTGKIITSFKTDSLGYDNGDVGDVTFTASATMFGIVKTDTLHYRIGFPLTANMAVGFLSSTDTLSTSIGVGGDIIFLFKQLGDTGSFAVDFADADLPNVREAATSVASHLFGLAPLFCLIGYNCTSGDVVVEPPTLGAVRSFPVPGTYYFHVSPSGAVGRINVVDER